MFENAADQFPSRTLRKRQCFPVSEFELFAGAERIEPAVEKFGRGWEKVRRFGHRRECGGSVSRRGVRCRVMRRRMSGNPAEDEHFQSGIAPEPVPSMESARRFARREQTGNPRGGVRRDPNSPERCVRTGTHFKTEIVEPR